MADTTTENAAATATQAPAAQDAASQEPAGTASPASPADGAQLAPDGGVREASDGGTEVAVAPVSPPEAAPRQVRSGGGQIDILLDTTMPVTVRLGEAEVRVGELLSMGEGSVLKLDKQVGEPVDLYLRGVRFATGHLVVVQDRLGVRIKEIISPQQ